MKKLLGILVFSWLFIGNVYSDNIVVSKHTLSPILYETMGYSSLDYAKAIAIAKCKTGTEGKRNPNGCYIYSINGVYVNASISTNKIDESIIGYCIAPSATSKNENYTIVINTNVSICDHHFISKKFDKEIFDFLKNKFGKFLSTSPFIIPGRSLVPYKTQIKSKTAKNSNNTNADLAKLEEEKRKIEKEKKKIEEEKKKIAEAKKKQEEEEKQRKEADAKLYIIGSGTGFFVSAEGHIVSNDHVVGICRKVASKIDGEIEYFNIIKTDEVNDLGIIKGEYKNPTYLSIKSDGAEYGEDVVAFGYPLADALSTSVKLTRGIVSSLSGPGNNYSEIQIDAAIQPGNSGGPVLNMEGQVVGVASSGLNKLYMLEQSEYIPENVNFAVAAPTLANFLKANGVKVNTQKFKINNTKELARIGRPATLQLFCMNTKAVFEELKQKKKHSDVLFEKVIDLR